MKSSSIIQSLLLLVSLLFHQVWCVHSTPHEFKLGTNNQLQQQQQKILLLNSIRGGAAVHKPQPLAFVSKNKVEKEASNFLDSAATTIGKQVRGCHFFFLGFKTVLLFRCLSRYATDSFLSVPKKQICIFFLHLISR